MIILISYIYIYTYIERERERERERDLAMIRDITRCENISMTIAKPKPYNTC